MLCPKFSLGPMVPITRETDLTTRRKLTQERELTEKARLSRAANTRTGY